MLATETIGNVLGETSLRSTSLKDLPYLKKRSCLTLENEKTTVRSKPDRAHQIKDNASFTQSPRKSINLLALELDI